jgi:hypothetical protein
MSERPAARLGDRQLCHPQREPAVTFHPMLLTQRLQDLGTDLARRRHPECLLGQGPRPAEVVSKSGPPREHLGLLPRDSGQRRPFVERGPRRLDVAGVDVGVNGAEPPTKAVGGAHIGRGRQRGPL